MSTEGPSLTIAVSTLGRRIEAIAAWDFDDRVHYLLLWQPAGQQGPPLVPFPANVEVVPLPGTGVTRSRNAAIEGCRTPWLWFMDDDVDLPRTSIDALLADLPTMQPHEVHIATVLGPEGRPVMRRDDGHVYGRRGILAIGTIQIVVHAPWVRAHGLRFPLRLGAGSDYPVCDEPVFLARAMRAGARVLHSDGLRVVHDEHSSGQGLDRPALVRSRAIAFREIFGMPLCLLVSAAFWWRHAAAIGSRWPWLFRYGPAD